MSVPSNLIPTRITQLPVAPVADENSLMMIVYQGNNYQIRVGDLLSVAGVPITRQVIAGTGMTGGGQLSSNVTLSIAPGGVGSTELASSGVTPGTYGTATEIPVFTVDATGRVMAATTIPATISGYVPDTRQVIAGEGLSGGGALSNNVTLDANLSNATPQAGFQAGSAGTSDDISRADHKHPAVNLAVDDEVDGILGLGNGGTARSIVADEGGIIWSGADGLYVGPVGAYGQVLASGGVGEYIWASVDVDVPRPANTVRAGPTAGPDAIPTFRALVNADLPGTIDGKTFTNVDVNSGTIDGTTIGGATPAAGTFTSVDTDYVDFAPALSPLPANATGRVYYDNADQFQTLAFQMNGSVVQHIGEEQFFRVKCLGSITKGQVVSFAGTLGASGGLIGKAATGLTPEQSNYILGIADESGINNDWIFVTSFGEVKNINTTGGAETWAQGDVLYYNPAVTGGLTNVKPTTPNAIAIVAAVVNVGVSNGILFVRPTFGSVLGGTDGNVQFGTLNNGDVIVYDSGDQRWENRAQSTLSVGSATTSTNLAGGAAGSIPYQTGAGSTTFLSASSGVLVGGTTPSYSTAPSLTGTNFTAIPNAALTNSSVTIGTTSISLGATSLTLGGLTSVAVTQDPTTALQVATKQYVDGLVSSGITYHTPVKYEVPSTTGNLTATYSNGVAGVGATLTNAGTLVAFTPDGVVASVNDRILIYNQTNAFENGVYTVTTVGDGSTAWVLTRATDADSYGLKDPNALGEGDAFFIQAGDTGAGETYVCNTSGTITFGTTNITFVQVSSSQVYSAGTGLTLTGTQFSLTSPVSAGTGGTGQTSYTSGDLLYATGSTTLSKLTIGASSRILTSTGSAPSWTDPSGITVGAATTSSNVAGGAANQIVYNTGSGATNFIVAPTISSTFLKWNGSAFVWDTAGSGTVTSVDVSGGTTGLTTSGGPVTTSGTITLAGTLVSTNGGTGLSSYAAGDLLYYATGTALSKLTIGTSTHILTSSGSAPQWTNPTTVTVGTATNLAGGVASQIPYQTGAGATSFIANGTAGQVLVSAGTSAPAWGGIDGGTF